MSALRSADEIGRFRACENRELSCHLRSRAADWRHVFAGGVLCAAIASAPALTIWNLSLATNAYVGMLQWFFVLAMLPEVLPAARRGLEGSLAFRAMVIGFLVCTIGWLAQDVPFETIDRTLFYLVQPLFVLAASAWFHRFDSDGLHALYRLKLWVTAGAVAYLFVMLWLAAVPDLDWRQVKRLPIYRNIRHLGYDLAIVALLGTACWMARPLAGSLFNWVVFVILGYVSVWSAGRGQILAFLIFLLVYFALMRGRQTRWTLFRPGAAFFLGGAVFCLLNPEMTLWILGRSSSGSADEIASGRFAIWANSLETFVACEWKAIAFGLGADAFVRHSIAPGLVQPHNIIIQIALEFGLVGLATLSVLIAAFTARCRDVVNEPHASVVAIGAVSALVALGLYSMIDGIFYHASPFFASMLLIAFVLSSQQHSEAHARS